LRAARRRQGERKRECERDRAPAQSE